MKVISIDLGTYSFFVWLGDFTNIYSLILINTNMKQKEKSFIIKWHDIIQYISKYNYKLLIHKYNFYR